MRRGSVSSWEPWARRNSANMAQIAGSRSEFMTSDLGLNDIEYKRNGGCFLSYKKTALIVVMITVGVITAGFIGAYLSLWSKKQNVNTLSFGEEDEIEGADVTAEKFSTSPLIFPSLNTVELTPVLEKENITKIKGRVIVQFTYNGTQPLSKLVLNAKGIEVSEAKLSSFNDQPILRNVHSRKKRDDASTEETLISETTNSTYTTLSDATVTNPPLVTVNGIASAVLANSSSDDILDSNNNTTFDSSNYNTSTDEISNSTSTPMEIVTNLDNDVNFVGKDDDIILKTTSSAQPDVIQKYSSTTPNTIIISSSTNQPETSIKINKVPISNSEMDVVNGFYVIYPKNPILMGDYSIEITYETKIDSENTFANFYDLENQRRWLFATKLKPLRVRMPFPGFHDLNSKVKFSLSIARPKTLITLSNMPLKSSNSVSNDWVMDHFEMSPPLSPHNLAFAIGDLQPIEEIATVGETNIPLTLWSRSSKTGETHFVTEKMGKIIQILNQFFSIPYPMPKLDVVALPNFDVEGRGNTGLIFLRETLLSVMNESSAIDKELAIKNLVKLITEQWVGGLVGVQNWTDNWFLEGTSIFLQHLFTDKIDPTIDLINSFGILQNSAFEMDAYEISRSLRSKLNPNLDSTFMDEIYKKGACLIRMMYSTLSDSSFRKGYKKFISRWINSNTDTTNFLDIISEEAQWLSNEVSFTEMMESWLNQTGFPVITVTRNYESASVIVRQEQFAFNNSTINKQRLWHIPLTYLIDGDDWSSPSKFLMKQEEEVTLKDVGKFNEKKWLLFNVNQTGYYRVNYDEDNWNLLTNVLNSTFNKFPVTMRTSLVDDALSLAWGGRLGYSTALNLIRYLNENEIHHSPWTVAFKNMIKLNNLLYNTPAYPSFQEFMIKFITPLFEKVTVSSVEESRLKLIAIRWACLVDNPNCRAYLESLTIVPSYLEEIHQCTLSKFGGKSEWNSLLTKISKTKDKETKLKLLATLPCFQTEWILQSLLNEILNEEKFDVSETLVLIRSFGKNPMATKSAFKFIQRHWNEIFEKFSKSYSILRAFLIASINGITDDQDLKDFQYFKEENYDKLKFFGHTIAVAEAKAKSRSSWLKINMIQFQMWINDYIKSTS